MESAMRTADAITITNTEYGKSLCGTAYPKVRSHFHMLLLVLRTPWRFVTSSF
jgi:hypothetical protein